MNRVLARISSLVACAVLAGPAAAQSGATAPEAAPPATPETAPPEPDVKSGGEEIIKIHGFVSATFYAQDRSFGFSNGQQALFPLPDTSGPDPWFLDGDVRNTRLTLSFGDLKVTDTFKVGGTLEVDFFGGYNGSGAFSKQQPMLRLRLANVDLKWGRLMVRLGQAWSPLFGYVPDSVSHIAFPLGYASAGFIGWRFPGAYLYYTLADGPTKVKLQVAAMEGSWNTPEGQLLDGRTAGNAAMVPQLEARIDFDGKAGEGAWGVFVAGHYDRKDLSGAGATAPDDTLDGWAGEVGAKLSVSILKLQGNAYYGRAIGQQFGAITQFGDIRGWGAWGQVGLDFTRSVGIYGFYGISDPNDQDVLDSGNSRLRNQTIAAMLKYSSGPFVLGLEWLHGILLHDAAELTTTGNQLAVSGRYNF